MRKKVEKLKTEKIKINKKPKNWFNSLFKNIKRLNNECK